MNQIIVYKATSQELDYFVAIQDQEQEWNCGIHDKQAMKKINGALFLIAKIQNHIVGCISVYKYSDCFGFIGIVYIEKEHRFKGIGKKLSNMGIQHLKECKSIAIDSYPNSQTMYKNFGFKQWQNIGDFQFYGKKSQGKGKFLKSVSDVSFQHLVEYDSSIFPAKRGDFLKQLISQPDSYSIVYQQNQKIKGYGVIRKGSIRYRMGPLFALNMEIAKQIFKQLRSFVDEKTSIDCATFSDNLEAVKLFEQCSYFRQDNGSRMIFGQLGKQNLHKVVVTTGWQFG